MNVKGTKMQQRQHNRKQTASNRARKAGENGVHIAGVTGSSPVSPTKLKQALRRKLKPANTVTRPHKCTEWVAILPHLGADAVQRFWEKVIVGRPDECWPWRAGKRGSCKGYGSFKIASYTTVMAHRVSYAIATGTEPGELLVCHQCDNPPCCNPGHLFLGTVKDNSVDMVNKGRHKSGPTKGSHNGAALLTARDVYKIMRRMKAGHNNCQIARDYGVHHSTISVIRTGRSWKHLTDRLNPGSPVPVLFEGE